MTNTTKKNNITDCFFIWIFFLVTSSPLLASEGIANQIAALSATSVYNIDNEELPNILIPFIKENNQIKALFIYEGSESSSFLTFYRKQDEFIFNQVVPEQLTKLKNYKASIKYNNSIIGQLVFYYEDNSQLDLTKEEQLWLDKKQTIKYVYDPDWEPFEWKNGLEKHVGLVADLLQIIKEKSGLNLVQEASDSWSQAIEKAKNKQVQMYSAVGITKERQSYMNFTSLNLLVAPFVFVSRVNDDFSNGFEAIGNKKIAVNKGYTIHGILKEKEPQLDLISIGASEENGFLQLRNGKIDVFVVNSPKAKYYINTYGFKDLKITYKTPYNLELKVAVSKEMPHELLSILDKSIATISNQTLGELYNKWTQGSNNLFTNNEKIYLQNKEFIKVCTNPNWAPIEFNLDGQPAGISIDILKTIKDTLKLDYQFVKTTSWKQSQEYLKDKKCDILPSAIKTNKREEYANFTSAYLKYDLVIIAKSINQKIKSLATISDKVMSRKKASGLIAKVKKAYPKIKIKETENTKGSFNAIMNNESDFTVSILPVFLYYKSKYGFEELNVIGYTSMKYHLSIAVRKDAPILLRVLEKALSTVPDSTSKLVHDKWVTAKEINVINWTLMFQIFGIFILFLAATLFWARKLNIAKAIALEATKEAQNAKDKAELALNLQVESEEKTRLLLTSVGEGIFGLDKEGFVNFINPSALKILQYDESEILGKKIYDIIHHSHADGSAYPVEECPMFQSLNKNNTTTIDDEVLWRKDGTSFPAEYKARSIVSNNQIKGSVVTFHDITERLKAHNILLKQQQEIQEIHKHTRESIEYAALIQGALIPENKIFHKYFKDSFTLWQPKDIVGGDIYFAEELRHDDEFLLMVIDCTGHGVPGAFVTMLVKAIERQIVSQIIAGDEIVSPAKILSIFNKTIKHLLKQDDANSISNAGFDAGFLYYDKKRKIIKFSGAETPLFLIQNNELRIIKGDRHSIGYKKSNPNYEFTEHTIDVSKATQIYLTTDGFLDQSGGDKGFCFGKKRFTKLIKENKDLSFSDQKEILLYGLKKYQAEEERNDDVTVVGLKI